jgi:hypothetical protein
VSEKSEERDEEEEKEKLKFEIFRDHHISILLPLHTHPMVKEAEEVGKGVRRRNGEGGMKEGWIRRSCI